MTEKKLRDKYRKNPVFMYKCYISNASHRNIKFILTYEQFLTFWQKPCFYCGNPIKTIGLDRINSLQEYSMDNVISCCQQCNLAKLDYTQQEFIDMCCKVANKFNRVDL